MKRGEMAVRRAPCGSLGEAWNARVEDWVQDGMRLVRLAKEYKERYRRTVCAKCSPEQQVRRRCVALKPRCATKACEHMDRACAAKYRRLVKAHEGSHPFYQGLRMDAELARRELARQGKKPEPGSLAYTW